LPSDPAPPDLVLNRHCAQSEFRKQCRQKAIEEDDLSLLTGISESERTGTVVEEFSLSGSCPVSSDRAGRRSERRTPRVVGILILSEGQETFHWFRADEKSEEPECLRRFGRTRRREDFCMMCGCRT
jgi:hypothetical protein